MSLILAVDVLGEREYDGCVDYGMIVFLDEKVAGVTGPDVGYTGIYVSSAGGDNMSVVGAASLPG